MPQLKKDPSTRARRNKASTAATLSAAKLHVVEDYSTWKVADLRAEIDHLNKDRSDEFQLPRAGTKAVLIETLTRATSPVPQIPEEPGGWHPQVEKWWAEAWTSPMSNEWHPETDFFNLYLVAVAFNITFKADSPAVRLKAMSELRQQRSDLGLAPYPRRRLEWAFESADEAKDRGAQRRNSGKLPTPAAKKKRPDPRAGLHAV